MVIVLNLFKQIMAISRKSRMRAGLVARTLFCHLLILSFLFNSFVITVAGERRVRGNESKAEVSVEKREMPAKSPGQQDSVRVFKKRLVKTGKQTRFAGSFDL